ncbi:MAG: ATP-dependent Clp protease proteolytic subunit [Actinomycetota bacterium]|nr:ATP-dependent Clp protease proteolytic subunit [Actinomycetota bacterium]
MVKKTDLSGRELTEKEAAEFERWKVFDEAEKNRTLDDLRTVLYFGEIETDRSKEVVRKMLEFEAKDAGEPIILKISSSGGSALDGLAIVETMRTITSPVMTFCLGYAFSMALVVLAAGERGSRFCTRGSWVMMHQISAGRYQRFDELKTTFTFYERLNTQLAKILADSSGQKLTKIEQDMREDVWMAADQAKSFGLVDEII